MPIHNTQNPFHPIKTEDKFPTMLARAVYRKGLRFWRPKTWRYYHL